MKHRHLTLSDLSPAAIDDIIARGRRSDWGELARALIGDDRVRGTILRVCAAHVADPTAQRYHFWNYYAERAGTT